MAEGIRHRKVISIADDPTAASRVQPSNWNDDHTLICLKFGTMTPVANPEDGDVWVEAVGATVSLKVRRNGVTRTLASFTD